MTPLGNLAALDCYAILEAHNPYEKTYQDDLDVNHLVDDLYTGSKALNLDKIFLEQSDIGQPRGLMPGQQHLLC